MAKSAGPLVGPSGCGGALSCNLHQCLFPAPNFIVLLSVSYCKLLPSARGGDAKPALYYGPPGSQNSEVAPRTLVLNMKTNYTDGAQGSFQNGALVLAPRALNSYTDEEWELFKMGRSPWRRAHSP